MRLFVGLDIASEIAAALAAVQPKATSDVTLLAQPDMHVTLHFLGSCDRSAVEAALATVRAQRFAVSVRGLGQFSMRGGRRIFWAGVDLSAALDALHAAIGNALRATGFEPETRPYKPHVTLARLGARAPRGALCKLLADHDATDFGSFEAGEFLLFDTAESGSPHRYRRLRRYPLDR